MGGKGGTDKKLLEFFIQRVLKTTSLSQSALPPQKLKNHIAEYRMILYNE